MKTSTYTATALFSVEAGYARTSGLVMSVATGIILLRKIMERAWLWLIYQYSSYPYHKQ